MCRQQVRNTDIIKDERIKWLYEFSIVIYFRAGLLYQVKCAFLKVISITTSTTIIYIFRFRYLQPIGVCMHDLFSNYYIQAQFLLKFANILNGYSC